MTDDPAENRQASQATLALVLGIISVVCLPLLGPAAWAVARDELNGIDAGRRDPSSRGTASTARVLGIVGTVLLAVAVIAGLAVLIIQGPDIMRGIMDAPSGDGLEAAKQL
jgi:hypothetical protein